MKRLALSVVLLCAAAFAAGPAKVTITDTLYDQAGNLLTGTVAISNPSTFTSPDGYVVAAFNRLLVPVTNGAFTVSLVPNVGSTPSGTSYRVQYNLLGYAYPSELWVVPNTPSTTQNLNGVRAQTDPSLSLMFSASQLNPPSPCTNGQALEWVGGTWPVGAWQCVTGGAGGGATLETNGTNNTSQTVFNLQNGTGTTASNPSAGNVQVNVTYGTAANTAAQGNDSRITGASGSGVCSGNQWVQILNPNAAPSCTQPSFSVISGTVTNSQLANSYSGVGACAAHQWASTINGNAAPSCTQPSYADISGTSPALPATCATPCFFPTAVIGSENGSALATADIQPRKSLIPVGPLGSGTSYTLSTVIVLVDAGASTVQLGFRHSGATTALSPVLTPATVTNITDKVACANTAGTAISIEGVSVTCSALTSTALSQGDWLETVGGAADGTTKRMSISVRYAQ